MMGFSVATFSWVLDECNHLHPTLRGKRQHLLATNPIILHDNTKAHTAHCSRCQWSPSPLVMEILEHLPYSLDMSPCNYDLFAKMKEPLWGARYTTREELLLCCRVVTAGNQQKWMRWWCTTPSTNLTEGGTHGGGLYWRNVRLPQVIKSFQNYRGVATTFYPSLVL
jgi:hypothetical protein